MTSAKIKILTMSFCLLASSCSSKYSSSRTRSISSRCCRSPSIFSHSLGTESREVCYTLTYKSLTEWISEWATRKKVVWTILRRCSLASSLSLILVILVSSMCCCCCTNSMMRLFSASILSCSMRLHSACCFLNSSMCCLVALSFSIFSCLSLLGKRYI